MKIKLKPTLLNVIGEDAESRSFGSRVVGLVRVGIGNVFHLLDSGVSHVQLKINKNVGRLCYQKNIK
jgi:hypothetical protein